MKHPDKKVLLEMFSTMTKIRLFESELQKFFAAGKIPGFVHLYLGEEAVATGACAALKQTDMITSTHRGHGHCLAKGGDLKLMMAEIYGRSTGYCKGKGGSMHIADFNIGILGANGIVGGGGPWPWARPSVASTRIPRAYAPAFSAMARPTRAPRRNR